VQNQGNPFVVQGSGMAEIPGSPEANSSAKLLIVDDEPNVRFSIGEILRQKGYHVGEAGSGNEALALLEDTPYDLMVLDLRMPGMGGVEVMHRARQIRPDLPVIVLTAHASLESAIASVKCDVTDYMLKPCNMDDLTVTIVRALQERAKRLRRDHLLGRVSEAMEALRQTESVESSPAPVAAAPVPPLAIPQPPMPAQDVLQTGPLILDRQKRLARLETHPDRTVELTENEMSLLVAMMERPNQVFSCNQLADAALGYQGLDKWTVESSIRSSIFRLRQKIEAAPDAPHLIRTVRGRGYYISLA
jgi:DNA-binding response OmpR family regulator